MNDGERLAKADTVALWYAVTAYGDLVQAMHDMGTFTDAQIAAEGERLATAKSALRKVNAIRRDATKQQEKP